MPCCQVKVLRWRSTWKQANVSPEEVKSVSPATRSQTLRSPATWWAAAGDVHKRNYELCQIIRDATVNCKWSEETFTLLLLWYWPVSNVTPQTSSYGGRASEKGKPDLQCRWKESSGILQPGGEEEEGEQDPVELQGDGVQENQRQGGEVNVTCTGLKSDLPFTGHIHILFCDLGC